MRVDYNVEKLDGLFEVDLAAVTFDEVTCCPLCGSARVTDVSVLAASLVTAWCGDCRHLFQRRRPSREWYLEWYRSHWDRTGAGEGARDGGIDPERDRARTRGHVFDFVRPVLAPGLRVLDLGCGYGDELVPFANLGCEVAGVEASPSRASAAARRGLRVVCTAVEDVGRETFGTDFDLVFANHVLEHVCDPHAFLAALRRVLRPGGWLSITVPRLEADFLLHDFFFALHVHFFSRPSLSRLLRRHGFRIDRTLEEHQIRVLAAHAREAPEDADPLAFDGGGSDGRNGAPVEFFLARSAGPDWRDHRDRWRYCHWDLARPRVRELFAVRYGDERRDGHARVMKLRWSGAPELPIQFSPAARERTGAPFWVK